MEKSGCGEKREKRERNCRRIALARSYYYIEQRTGELARIIEHSARASMFSVTLDENKARSSPTAASSRAKAENDRAGKHASPTPVTSTDHPLRRSPLIFSRFLAFGVLSAQPCLAIARFHAPCGRDWN